MRKKILIAVLIYIAFLLLTTLTTTNRKDLIITLIVNSLPFVLYIVYVVYKDRKDKVQLTKNPAELRMISKDPFYFGLFNSMVSRFNFYFNNDNFYAIDENLRRMSFPLTHISELSRTGTIIGNTPIWQVKTFDQSGSEIIYKFSHNWTMWNSNFPDFQARLTAVNPAAIKSKGTFLRI